jgi:hypothetical protein
MKVISMAAAVLSLLGMGYAYGGIFWLRRGWKIYLRDVSDPWARAITRADRNLVEFYKTEADRTRDWVLSKNPLVWILQFNKPFGLSELVRQGQEHKPEAANV